MKIRLFANYVRKYYMKTKKRKLTTEEKAIVKYRKSKDKELMCCPFCGKFEAVICQWMDTLDPFCTWIECGNCHAMLEHMHDKDPRKVIDTLVNKWNTRKEPNK